ncbi:MAG: hypothetical protein V2I33_20645 [Kangiellaceae bacterium]|jgi:amino acid transporter|nr:hypothetical protein [Kangiellaceae bacterium]
MLLIIKSFKLDWKNDLLQEVLMVITYGGASTGDFSVWVCVTNDNGKDWYIRTIWLALVAPVVLICVVMGTWGVIWLVRKLRKTDHQERDFNLPTKVICSIIVTLFITYNWVVYTSLSLFNCYTLSGESIHAFDSEIVCDSSDTDWMNAAIASICSIAIWGILIPVSIFIFMWKKKAALNYRTDVITTDASAQTLSEDKAL